jgi:N-acetylglucosaminyl-diphospho-decaprenol L-rhamnosyltransferase
VTPRLTVVTVLYRSRTTLAKTLPTWVEAARGTAVEFVFVDHAPFLGCEELIAATLDEFVYLPDGSNPGFAAGCNKGVAAAASSHVLLLNPDVWLTPTALSTVAGALGPDPVAVGLEMRGGVYTGIKLHPLSLFIDRPSASGRAPLGPSGGAAVFPVEVFQLYGGMSARLFAWGEDMDLALRLTASGVRTRTLDLALPHAWGHSVEGDPELVRRRAFLLARNRILVAARAFSVPLLLVAVPWLAVAHLALALRRALQGLLVPFLKGVWSGVRTAASARHEWTGPRFGLRTLARHLGERADG